MALSRAAAAAARKAAKNRGLQGNRGADGSLRRAEEPWKAATDAMADIDMDVARQMIIDGDVTSKGAYGELAALGEKELISRHKRIEKEIYDLERESLDYQESRGDPRRDIEDLSYLDEAEYSRSDKLEQLNKEVEMIEDILDRLKVDYSPIEHLEP